MNPSLFKVLDPEPVATLLTTCYYYQRLYIDKTESVGHSNNWAPLRDTGEPL